MVLKELPRNCRCTQPDWCVKCLMSLSQGAAMAKQLGAEAYLECSAFTSEKSIHSVFRTAALACINKLQPVPKPSPTRRLSKRLLHLPSKSDLLTSTFKKEKAKSCSVMWVDASRVFKVSHMTQPPAPASLVLGKGGWARFIRTSCWILPSPPQKPNTASEQVDTLLSTCSWTFQRTSIFFHNLLFEETVLVKVRTLSCHFSPVTECNYNSVTPVWFTCHTLNLSKRVTLILM